MQKFLQVSSSFVLALVFFCAGLSEVAQAAISASTWHGYSQSKRNSLILDRAKTYCPLPSPQLPASSQYSAIGRYVYPLECKSWVTQVVKEASDGVVKLPSNYSDPTLDYKWTASTDVRIVLKTDGNEAKDWTNNLMGTAEGVYGTAGVPVSSTSNFTLKPGQIIQAHMFFFRTENGKTIRFDILHTMIIYSVGSSSVTVIDCNGIAKNTVGMRSYQFRNSAKSGFWDRITKFTLYEVK